jgi:hypothetical protein
MLAMIGRDQRGPNNFLGLWVPAFAGTTPIKVRQSAYNRITAWRSILPVPVFGNSSMNLISRGYL